MAFLLSPKTGDTPQSYLFISSIPVSINGGEATTYGDVNPTYIGIGDILTWLSEQRAAISYENNVEGSVVKTAPVNSPYTVEAVPGADTAYLMFSD